MGDAADARLLIFHQLIIFSFKGAGVYININFQNSMEVLWTFLTKKLCADVVVYVIQPRVYHDMHREKMSECLHDIRATLPVMMINRYGRYPEVWPV